jgi:hypothetical protein
MVCGNVALRSTPLLVALMTWPGPTIAASIFSRQQRRNCERVARHENELHVEAMFLEQTTVPCDPKHGHGLTGDAAG